MLDRSSAFALAPAGHFELLLSRTASRSNRLYRSPSELDPGGRSREDPTKRQHDPLSPDTHSTHFPPLDLRPESPTTASESLGNSSNVPCRVIHLTSLGSQPLLTVPSTNGGGALRSRPNHELRYARGKCDRHEVHAPDHASYIRLGPTSGSGCKQHTQHVFGRLPEQQYSP